jgi:phage portal protein BeeE
MRLIDRIRYRQMFYNEALASGAAVLTTSYGSPDRETILPTLASMANNAYSGNGVVFAAILARVMLGSEAQFKYQNLLNNRLFGNNDPDGLPVLENPWPGGTTGELIARAIQDVDLAGNFYVAKGSDQLLRLRPDQVTIVSESARDAATGNSYRRVTGYLWDPTPTPGVAGPSKSAELYTVDEVAHWSPIPDPLANWRGMSWLTPVIREIAADAALTTYKQRYLDNAASPNLLIKYKQKLQPETIDLLRERITARHGGADNAFRTMILDQGADTTVIGNTLEQMNFSTVQAAGENRILVASGVPSIVVGIEAGLNASTYSNYQQAMRRFADLTMRPLWRSLCACLEKLIVVPGPARLWYDTSDIAALRQGEQERAQTSLTQATAIGELVKYGFDPMSAVAAVTADDFGQLTHPGLPLNITSDVPMAKPAPIVLPGPGAGVVSATAPAPDTTPTNGKGP